MQFSATPQTLAQLDQVPLYKFGTALNMLDNMQSADQQNLADLPNSIAHNQAMRPLQEQQLDVQNQQGLAQLPGMRARSSMEQRKNQEEDLFTPERHAEFYAKHGAEKMKQFAQQLTDSGTVALNAASIAAQLPIGGTQAAKDMFKKAGVAWHPEWDFIPREQLVQRLQNLGEEMTTNGSKSQALITQMQMKADIANATAQAGLKKEQMAIDAGKYAKAQRQSLAISLLNSKSAAQTAELYANASAAARANGDMDSAAEYAQLAIIARQRAAEDAKNKSAANPGIDVPAVANLPPREGATAAAPVTSGPAQSATVTVTHPDGRVGTIPRSQLKDALAAGYKEKGQ
jgi:hypothetical protein